MSYYYACANEGLDCLQFEVIVLAGWGGAGLLSNLSKGRDANFSRVPLGKGMRQFEYAHTGNDSLKFANSQQPRHLPSAGS